MYKDRALRKKILQHLEDLPDSADIGVREMAAMLDVQESTLRRQTLRDGLLKSEGIPKPTRNGSRGPLRWKLGQVKQARRREEP